MNYRTFDDLAKECLVLARKLPRDIDVVVGVPRSGLLPANLLALYLNVPLGDVEGFAAGRLLGGGRRTGEQDSAQFLSVPRKALVVDDSLDSGWQINAVRQFLREFCPTHQFVFSAIFIKPGMQNCVDYYAEEVSTPRLFQWNVLDRKGLRTSCVDVDGVLCEDPTPGENDDGDCYIRFLSEAKPLFIPKHEIGWLVTCRLEKYRALTEHWLRGHRVIYRELLMMEYPNKAARVRANKHALFKAKNYLETRAELFIESSRRQAFEIARMANKPVFSVELFDLVEPAESVTLKRRLRAKLRQLKEQVLAFMRPSAQHPPA